MNDTEKIIAHYEKKIQILTNEIYEIEKRRAIFYEIIKDVKELTKKVEDVREILANDPGPHKI